MLPFKQLNTWPVAIIAYFVGFIGATLGLVFLALAHQDDLVTQDYYEQELQFQRQIDRLKRTQPLQPGLAVRYDPATRTIRIALPMEHARGCTHGQIQFYRPSAARLDRQLKLQVDPATGVQAVDARPFEPGLWTVRISWTVSAQQFFFDQKLVIAAKARKEEVKTENPCVLCVLSRPSSPSDFRNPNAGPPPRHRGTELGGALRPLSPSGAFGLRSSEFFRISALGFRV